MKPKWCSMNDNGMHPQPHSHYLLAASHSTPPPPDLHQDHPVKSWTQLLLGGLGGGEEERWGTSHLQQQKKLEKWDDEALNSKPRAAVSVDEESSSTQTAIDCYGHADDHEEFEFQSYTCWPCHHQPAPPPTSCITNNIFSFSSCITNTIFSFSSCITNTIFNFSSSTNHHHNQHHSSSQCHSSGNGGESNNAWVQQYSSPQPALKVRKEKLGDRITALHQLVAPFGKTDTASVLSETIGYIRFLEGQIEALSSPYLRNAEGNRVQERKCMLSEELSQDLEGGSNLRSRGLCLVPVSCSQHVCNGIGANYWAQAAFHFPADSAAAGFGCNLGGSHAAVKLAL